MNQKFLPEPHWINENDWLCTVELFPTDDPEARLFAADVVGYLMGYAHLTDTRSLALVGDPVDNTYEFLFSFSSLEGKKQFLELIRSNEDLGEAYIENDLCVILPTIEEIRHARPIAKVLPQDVFTRATLIVASLCSGDWDTTPN
jgi:hypothetical protein